MSNFYLNSGTETDVKQIALFITITSNSE